MTSRVPAICAGHAYARPRPMSNENRFWEMRRWPGGRQFARPRPPRGSTQEAVACPIPQASVRRSVRHWEDRKRLENLSRVEVCVRRETAACSGKCISRMQHVLASPCVSVASPPCGARPSSDISMPGVTRIARAHGLEQGDERAEGGAYHGKQCRRRPGRGPRGS